MTIPPTVPAPASLGGYRLVRTLGTGPRATVHLGHADGHPPVAVKVFAAAVPGERIEREAEALMRAAGDHVVRLDDLTLDARGRPAFLLERIAGPSLGGLLDRRRTIRLGEAVTILAPLATTLARMHRDGVVHGGLDPASVLFTEAGSPTLVGFGDAELLDLPATGRARVAARTALLERDEAALRRLALTVLEATEIAPGAPHHAEHALPGPAHDDPGTYAERLAAAVFDLAEPEPVDLDAPASAVSALPGRLGAESGHQGASAARGSLVLDALQLPDWLRGVLGGRVATALGRLRSAAGSVRRPFWVAGGAAGVALTAALLLVPSPAPSPGPGARTPERGGTPTPAAGPATTDEGVLIGDDPAAAAVELLDRRTECFRELSVLCLDTVHQPDSAASLADAAAILAAQEGGGIDADGVVLDGPVEVVERLGDTALVRIAPPNAEPAPVLLLRTEAGWRIRGFPGAALDAAEAD